MEQERQKKVEDRLKKLYNRDLYVEEKAAIVICSSIFKAHPELSDQEIGLFIQNYRAVLRPSKRVSKRVRRRNRRNCVWANSSY